MAQTNYTPIQLYFSTTATNQPTSGNLIDGELAINTADGKLFYKDNLGSVQLIASKASTAGTVSTVSVVSANGFTGTVATNTTTPAITLTTSVTGVLKGNGTAISAAVSGTDYAPATSGTSILYGDGAGGFSSVTIGTGVSFVGGTLSATGSGGTVTAVSVVSANGFAGTSSGGATPALTLTTSITGVLKGNGTAISAATAATDYVAPSAYASANGLTMATARLLGRTTASTGAAEEITVGSGLSLSAGTLTSTGSGGTVTTVGFTGGLISVATATTTPALTVAGTSGGIVYFSSASTWASSAALAANAIVLGGGAGVAPATTTTGTGVVTALGIAVNSGAGGLVTNTGTATLTNKTLTTPIISSISNTGTLTLPTSTDTLVGRATTDTLTNKRITPRVTTTTSSATPSINTDTTDQYGLTALAVNITSVTVTGTPTNGQKLWIYIVGTAARTIAWGASFESSTVTLPTTTVTTNRLDVGFVWNAATSKWRCVAVA
jgi:hypothetical protein